MAKDKSSSKAAKASKPVEAVKAGRVTKPAEASKTKATAKAAVKGAEKEKKSKKSKKEPTPEPSSSEEESDDETSASSDSSDSESEEEAKPKTNGAAKAAKADSDSESDSGSDSSESESEDEAPAKKAAAPKANGKAKAESDSDDSSDSDSDEESDAKADDAKDDSSDSDSSDSDEEEEEKPKVENKKRKAEAEAAAPEATPKRAKVMVEGELKEATANLFIGNLSWNVDEEWLTREFEEFGELAGVRIITDRDSGRSKGFGYIEFTDAANAAKALEAKTGADLDGRAIRLDFSEGRQNKNGATPQQRSNDRASKFGDAPKEPTATLWVGNISFDADESTLTEYFQEHGTIKGIRLPTDRETGEPKGFGYVEMGSIDEAKVAFEALQGADVAGRPIRLDYAGERPANNDRGRGGFGGGRGGGRGGFGDRGGRGGGRGGFGGRGGARGGARGGRGGTTNRGGFGDFSGKKTTF